MNPGNERKIITECINVMFEMGTTVVGLERTLQQLCQAIVGVEVKLGELAVSVPEGYTHAPGCVQRGTGWHTCDPVPVKPCMDEECISSGRAALCDTHGDEFFRQVDGIEPVECLRCEQHEVIFGGPCAEHRS